MKGIFHYALFWIAVFLNVAGILIGASVYEGQFALHPSYLAIFVPDCPLYVFLSLLVIFGIIQNDTFSFLVSIGMVKYGLWTIFVLLFHYGYYFAPDMLALSAVFVIGHIGMALEGLALLPKKKITMLMLSLAFCWFLLNDYSDYVLGTAPLLPPGGLAFVGAVTVASSALIPLALFALSERIRRNVLVARLRGILSVAG